MRHNISFPGVLPAVEARARHDARVTALRAAARGQWYHGKVRLIIPLLSTSARLAGVCAFCGEIHTHGVIEGFHGGAHCLPAFDAHRFMNAAGEEFFSGDGYIVSAE